MFTPRPSNAAHFQNLTTPNGVGTDLLADLARDVVPDGADIGAYNDGWRATTGIDYHDNDRSDVSDDDDGRRQALYGDNVPDGYDPDQEGWGDNSERTTYPTDRRHVRDNAWDDVN